jgi:DNA-binding MarR family transcriptional regulator
MGQDLMAKSALQHEIRKKRPFASPEVEASLNLVRTQDYLQGQFARLFGEHGLSPPLYNVLRILRGHGGEGLPCQEIAAQMITRMPDITRLVDRLEKAGLVERGRTHEDRRVVLVSITQAGLEKLAVLDAPVLDLHRQLLGHMTRGELTELNRLLVKARRAESSGD